MEDGGRRRRRFSCMHVYILVSHAVEHSEINLRSRNDVYHTVPTFNLTHSYYIPSIPTIPYTIVASTLFAVPDRTDRAVPFDTPLP